MSILALFYSMDDFWHLVGISQQFSLPRLHFAMDWLITAIDWCALLTDCFSHSGLSSYCSQFLSKYGQNDARPEQR